MNWYVPDAFVQIPTPEKTSIQNKYISVKHMRSAHIARSMAIGELARIFRVNESAGENVSTVSRVATLDIASI